MKIVIYTRVSTHEQAAEGLSLDAQEEQCRGYAKSQRTTGNVEVVVEKGVSGSIPVADRPMGGAMLERLKKGDVLIAAKLDRLFRSTMDAPTVVEDLKRRGVQLHLIDLGGAVSNGVGELFLTIVAAFARAERDRIAERVRDTRRQPKDCTRAAASRSAMTSRPTRTARSGSSVTAPKRPC